MAKNGRLYLIPTTLGPSEPLEVLPISVKKRIENIGIFIVENEKSARRFIKKIVPRKSQGGLKIYVLDKYTSELESKAFLDPCLRGADVGLISEAGVPAVADPGANMVMLAHQKQIQVIPLVGPSSIILAMMGSGLNGQNFSFNGYLPIDRQERKKKIKFFEKHSRLTQQSQIFIETPYRNQKLFNELKAVLTPTTYLNISMDLTLPTEYVKTLQVKDWKNENPDLHKKPCIFIFHKY